MSWRNELTVGILRAERIFFGTTNGGLGSELSVTELGFLDGITAGVAQASKALVLDASADLVSGINDFDIDGNLAVNGGQIEVGTQDVQEGAIFVYGAITASTIGGKIELQTAADHDTTIDSYSVRVVSDDLYIGPATDPDSLMYAGGAEQWTITGPNGLLVNAGAVGPSEIVAGEADVSGGTISAHGKETGETAGGAFRLYNPTDHDTNDDYFEMTSASGVFQIGGNLTGVFMTYNPATDIVEFTAGNGFYTDRPAEFSGTFTLQGNVANFTIGDAELINGQLDIAGGPAGQTQGGKLVLETADDHDTTIASFIVQATSETMQIGSVLLPNAIEITSAIINFNESLYCDQAVGLAGTLTCQGVVNLGGATSVALPSTWTIAGASVGASAAELDYLDIVTLGEGAASKAIVLDAGDDWIAPASCNIDMESNAGCVFNIEVGGLQLGGVSTTITAAELNILDNQVASVSFTPTGGAGSGTVVTDFKDAAGVQMATASAFTFWFSSVSTGLDFLPITTSVAANKGAVDKEGAAAGADLFHGITDAAGEFDVTVTAAADDYYMVVQLPNGKLQIAAVLTLS